MPQIINFRGKILVPANILTVANLTTLNNLSHFFGINEISNSIVLSHVFTIEELSFDQPATQQPMLGQAFSFTPTFTGTPTFSIIAGSLPDGLTLNPSTGTISGTLTAVGLLNNVGNESITMRATQFSETIDRTFSIIGQGIALPTPVAYYQFDTATGNMVDSINGHNGTATVGGTTFPTGLFGEGVQFAGGGNDRITLPSSLFTAFTGLSAASLAFAFKTSDTSASNACFELNIDAGGSGMRSRFFASIDSQKIVWVARSQFSDNTNVSVTGATNCADGQWHSFVGTVNLSTDDIIAYLDGIQDAAQLSAGLGAATFQAETQATHAIGHFQTLNPGRTALIGTLDELAIWGSELSANQAATVAWLQKKGITLDDWI